ncbi:Lung seven transmembrane receptor family protein isoform 2 [Hibiscus syriacus]|uniref:Lung seven transmembrane receptor family protein isoform 2 n=1 Tax=Hibiscus syriacus TaxID=106335 RepID=A0A6A3CML8_HIBSY|nr:Lung seven transmembrane receptor family protein isoform 2 [Hibiscus syriacus]
MLNIKEVSQFIFFFERLKLWGDDWGFGLRGQRAVCCAADLAKLDVCSEGEVIYRPSAVTPNWPKVFGVAFKEDDEVANLRYRSIKVTKTGMYNLYFIHCDANLKDLTVEGKTVWKNPAGYLPVCKILERGTSFANCITLVITLGMLEMALWYFDYAEFNENGIRPVAITVWAVTFGTIKCTVSRIIILMLSMGYGVVRPTLGGLTLKVIMLGVTFFLASEVLELVENAGAVSDLSGKARRMMVKLDIYRRFTNALVVAVIVSVGWTCYELYFKSNYVYNEQWQTAWIIPAFWQVLSFSMLCVICILWAPSRTLTRSAAEARPLQGSNGATNGDLEEDKTD